MRYFECVLKVILPKVILLGVFAYAVVQASLNFELFTQSSTRLSLAFIVIALLAVLFGLFGKEYLAVRKLILLAGAIFGTTVCLTLATGDTKQLGFIVFLGLIAGAAMVFFEKLRLYLPVILSETKKWFFDQLELQFPNWYKPAPSQQTINQSTRTRSASSTTS